MKKAEKYSKKYLRHEVDEIRNSARDSVLKELTIFEKAIIYKYSDDGYEDLNEKLRVSGGKNSSEFGRILNLSLSKLPDFSGLVYRGVNLTQQELFKYENTYRSQGELIEPTFVSTSKSRLIASEYSRGDTLFIIYSRSGKEIEKIAKFGENSSQNEKEVVFRPNRAFRILEIRRENNCTLITMEEK